MFPDSIQPTRDVQLNRAESRLPLRFDKRSCILLVEVKGEHMPTAHRIDLPQGTLDLLILQTLVLEPQHGWAISERVQQISSDVLCIQQGSLYPALHRLERRGWIKARWGISENNRRAKFYGLTKSGRQQLEIEKDTWERLTAAMAQVLGTA
jgi:transcriptional regulator